MMCVLSMIDGMAVENYVANGEGSVADRNRWIRWHNPWNARRRCATLCCPTYRTEGFFQKLHFDNAIFWLWGSRSKIDIACAEVAIAVVVGIYTQFYVIWRRIIIKEKATVSRLRLSWKN